MIYYTIFILSGFNILGGGVQDFLPNKNCLLMFLTHPCDGLGNCAVTKTCMHMKIIQPEKSRTSSFWLVCAVAAERSD